MVTIYPFSLKFLLWRNFTTSFIYFFSFILIYCYTRDEHLRRELKGAQQLELGRRIFIRREWTDYRVLRSLSFFFVRSFVRSFVRLYVHALWTESADSSGASLWFSQLPEKLAWLSFSMPSPGSYTLHSQRLVTVVAVVSTSCIPLRFYIAEFATVRTLILWESCPKCTL